jgi:ABC-type uncharacterized transport system ATPase subunit
VIGPNGAGKITMMDVITSKTRPQSGITVSRHGGDCRAHNMYYPRRHR